ncbi:ImmA/IrrE family metallo-endopeptidase [Streptomyces sp. SCA3-4]|uniref:ImmA/IrrE family metallo-endopeptidase n=1 Tax=Streptomyces sichuanensis TaxID=2871810 RepID=UPI001CE2EB3B|nr:ImmA/IrrE family metallo-endopeptidase [Streptomyces sichuanensis]MCA6090970.1 ImmA/IrrE family metallo-endopeptidase [Streptomyces sichuanensis]
MTTHAFNQKASTPQFALDGPVCARVPEASNGTYSPLERAEQLGLHVRYTELSDSWAWWVPSRRLIILSTRLTAVQERCALAHELEHAQRGDVDCRVVEHPAARIWGRRQERRADEAAARRLVSTAALEAAMRWAHSYEEAAQELHVTEHMLRVRLRLYRNELECPDTLRIAG